ncbi:hypothetical protein CASFOL_024280 [Castilleja foliolosa]|uniref:Uncharacterized protein n=1 Tax=Castilleja foliolosa TaxID=1961234 RepID=A0ABD3CMV3_9LAMI
MDDTNMLAADCIVISCCCQCMILKVLIFVILKLPNKLFKKTMKYAKKFRTARDKKTDIETMRYDRDSFWDKSFRIDIDDFYLAESNDRFGRCCMDEIERVLGDYSGRGEFAFGSFWGAEVSSSRSFQSCCKEDVIDYDDVRYRLMDLFGNVKFSCH